MKRYFTLALMVAAFALMASAQDDMKPVRATGVDIPTEEEETLPMTTGLYAVQADELTPVVNTNRAPKHAPKKVASAELAGPAVALYTSATANFANTGRSVTLTQEGDSLVMTNFHAKGFKVKMKVNDDGTVVIPLQTVGSLEQYGHCIIAPSKIKDNQFSQDSTRNEITGVVINKDSIQVDDLFQLYFPETNYFYYTGSGLMVARANATMSQTLLGGSKETYNIIAKQEGNDVTLVNFYNYGATLVATAQAGSRLRIGTNTVLTGTNTTQHGKTYRIHDYTVADGVFTAKYSSDLFYAYSDSPTHCAWNDLWMVKASISYYGVYTSGGLTFSEPIVYPETPEITLNGGGTEEDPYIIANTNDWDTFAELTEMGQMFAGKYVKITADLDYSNMSFPIAGDSSTPFCGTLDGGGHTITVNYVAPDTRNNVAVMNTLGETAVVKNITTRGSFTISGGSRAAGIAGNMWVGAKIENCHNYADIICNGNGQLIAGIAARGMRHHSIINCHNEGNLIHNGTNTDGFVGGILGDAQECDLIDCYNVGKFILDDTKVGTVGGITGRVCMGEMKNCYNTADIKALTNVGGLVANSTSNDYRSAIIADNCWNSGNIEMTYVATTNLPSGGLFAMLPGGSSVTNCYNTGNVTGLNYVGGIIGNITGSSAKVPRVLVKNCYNTGDITSYIEGKVAYAGGIQGFSGDYETMDSCYNVGNVKGNGWTVGGVVGHMQGASDELKNCWNTGDVTSVGGYWTGGVVGNASQTFPITNVWNTGKVTAVSRVGGIIGYSGYASKLSKSWNVGEVVATGTAKGTGTTAGHSVGGLCGYTGTQVTDCYNAAKVTGTTRVGGISGYTYAATATKAYNTFDRVVNVGEIVCGKDTCGHITGTNIELNPKQWMPTGVPTPNYIKEAYFLNTINENCRTQSDTIQTGLNVAQMCALVPGENWASFDDYSFPIIKGNEDNPYAKLYSVAVVPAETEEDPAVITMDFNVGAPAGVEWTSSYPGLSFNGNVATFDNAPYEGEITLTAKVVSNLPSRVKKVDGQVNALSRQFVINVKKAATTGVETLATDKAVKSVRYFNLQGAELSEAAQGMNIIVTTYTDGTQNSIKVIK